MNNPTFRSSLPFPSAENFSGTNLLSLLLKPLLHTVSSGSLPILLHQALSICKWISQLPKPLQLLQDSPPVVHLVAGTFISFFSQHSKVLRSREVTLVRFNKGPKFGILNFLFFNVAVHYNRQLWFRKCVLLDSIGFIFFLFYLLLVQAAAEKTNRKFFFFFCLTTIRGPLNSGISKASDAVVDEADYQDYGALNFDDDVVTKVWQQLKYLSNNERSMYA